MLARVDAPVPATCAAGCSGTSSRSTCSATARAAARRPIYWPLSTASGSYTLWLYYPSLTSQTLYTAVNDFVEPKLKQVGQEAAALRNKGSARIREDDKKLEALQTLERELIELRDTLLQIAPTYRPNHDDGVQITAAPLWPLFRHKPWQKVLKDTWAKLEKGDYDWAHLAMAYWPDRVREKCKTDKSLAIAHDLEHLYVEPEPKPAKSRGARRGRTNENRQLHPGRDLPAPAEEGSSWSSTIRTGATATFADRWRTRTLRWSTPAKAASKPRGRHAGARLSGQARTAQGAAGLRSGQPASHRRRAASRSFAVYAACGAIFPDGDGMAM